MKYFTLKVPLVFLFFIIFNSCFGSKPVDFQVTGTTEVLFGNSHAAKEGSLDFSSPKKLEFKFDDSFMNTPGLSFVIDYNFDKTPTPALREISSLVLDMGQISWELPMDSGRVRYSIPVQDSFDGQFNIVFNTTEKMKKEDAPVFQITTLGFSDRWFGFFTDADGIVNSTPFINRTGNGSYEIDVPPVFKANGSYAQIDAVFSGQGALEFANNRIETFPGNSKISVPSAMYKTEGKAALFAQELESFILTFSQPPIFPEPINADPALVIEYPRENWRNRNYEIFRWGNFPSLLIFDFADYAVQDRMLKRLAFFIEKAGFRGRLAYDYEINDLHGWNAHDYKAEDLAKFFDAARKANFPLLAEERELEKILLSEKIIAEEKGSIVQGIGAIISISRESPSYLRYRFMAHEGYHGIYFIDENFRNFNLRRWNQLPSAAKRFIVSYFEFQQYDVRDEYLLLNEFMAHVLQQSSSQAAEYFGKQIPERLEDSWRAPVLPQKDESSGTWPALAEAFTAEAQAFSAYVNQRWGLSAGRVWALRVR
jgi:hypothetical protein